MKQQLRRANKWIKAAARHMHWSEQADDMRWLWLCWELNQKRPHSSLQRGARDLPREREVLVTISQLSENGW